MLQREKKSKICAWCVVFMLFHFNWSSHLITMYSLLHKLFIMYSSGCCERYLRDLVSYFWLMSLHLFENLRSHFCLILIICVSLDLRFFLHGCFSVTCFNVISVHCGVVLFWVFGLLMFVIFRFASLSHVEFFSFGHWSPSSLFRWDWTLGCGASLQWSVLDPAMVGATHLRSDFCMLDMMKFYPLFIGWGRTPP